MWRLNCLANNVVIVVSIVMYALYALPYHVPISADLCTKLFAVNIYVSPKNCSTWNVYYVLLHIMFSPGILNYNWSIAQCIRLFLKEFKKNTKNVYTQMKRVYDYAIIVMLLFIDWTIDKSSAVSNDFVLHLICAQGC